VGIFRSAAMLSVSGDHLPSSGLVYLAFRVSFQETLERLVLSRQVDDGNEVFGYLTEVPFLRGVAPHVQLDLLADAWHRHCDPKKHEATLVDESVIYAVCETAARVTEEDPNIITHSLITGPRQVSIQVDSFLPGELRNLHLSLANEGDFLLVSQFEDMNPDDALTLKQQFSLEPERTEPMYDVLGRWHITPGLPERLDGLITDREQVRTSYVMDEVLQTRTPPRK
jgi:hypothetical protein